MVSTFGNPSAPLPVSVQATFWWRLSRGNWQGVPCAVSKRSGQRAWAVGNRGTTAQSSSTVAVAVDDPPTGGEVAGGGAGIGGLDEPQSFEVGPDVGWLVRGCR